MNYYSPEMVEPCPVPIVQHVVVVRETMVDSNGIVLGAWSSQLHHAFFDCRLPNSKSFISTNKTYDNTLC